MKYILATTDAHGRRRVERRSVDYFWLLANAKHIDHDKYRVEIYKGNWTLVKEV